MGLVWLNPAGCQFIITTIMCHPSQSYGKICSGDLSDFSQRKNLCVDEWAQCVLWVWVSKVYFCCAILTSEDINTAILPSWGLDSVVLDPSETGICLPRLTLSTPMSVSDDKTRFNVSKTEETGSNRSHMGCESFLNRPRHMSSVQRPQFRQYMYCRTIVHKYLHY